MNAQEMLDDYNRLTQLCEAKDAEIAKLRTSLSGQTCFVPPEFQQQLSEAQAQIAMLSEFQEGQWWIREIDNIRREYLSDDAYRAIAVVHNLLKTISASAESVAAWEKDKLEPLRKRIAVLEERKSKRAYFKKNGDLLSK